MNLSVAISVHQLTSTKKQKEESLHVSQGDIYEYNGP